MTLSAVASNVGELIQAGIAMVLLTCVLRRGAPNRLTARMGAEAAQFCVAITGLVCGWILFGLLALLPFMSSIVGGSWIPGFLVRLTQHPVLGTLAGFLFSVLSLVFVMLLPNRILTSRATTLTPSARWAVVSAGFYLSTLWLDVLRLSFSVSTVTAAPSSLATTALLYLGPIGGAYFADLYLQTKRTRVLSGVSLTQIVGFFEASALLAQMIQTGSVHLDEVQYVRLLSEMVYSLPGVAILIVTILGTPAVLSTATPRLRTAQARRIRQVTPGIPSRL